jgi:hypothetical protein
MVGAMDTERKMSLVEAVFTGRKAAYSIPEFCHDHNISRSSYYNLKRDGIAPREMRVNSRVLISAEAARDWRVEREQAAAKVGA